MMSDTLANVAAPAPAVSSSGKTVKAPKVKTVAELLKPVLTQEGAGKLAATWIGFVRSAIETHGSADVLTWISAEMKTYTSAEQRNADRRYKTLSECKGIVRAYQVAPTLFDAKATDWNAFYGECVKINAEQRAKDQEANMVQTLVDAGLEKADAAKRAASAIRAKEAAKEAARMAKKAPTAGSTLTQILGLINKLPTMEDRETVAKALRKLTFAHGEWKLPE